MGKIRDLIEKLEKAKYIKREGTPGNYKYTYPEGSKPKEGGKTFQERLDKYNKESAKEEESKKGKPFLHDLVKDILVGNKLNHHSSSVMHSIYPLNTIKNINKETVKESLEHSEPSIKGKLSDRELEGIVEALKRERGPSKAFKKVKKSFDDFIVDELNKAKNKKSLKEIALDAIGKISKKYPGKKTKQSKQASMGVRG